MREMLDALRGDESPGELLFGPRTPHTRDATMTEQIPLPPPTQPTDGLLLHRCRDCQCFRERLDDGRCERCAMQRKPRLAILGWRFSAAIGGEETVAIEVRCPRCFREYEIAAELGCYYHAVTHFEDIGDTECACGFDAAPLESRLLAYIQSNLDHDEEGDETYIYNRGLR